jgi:valyl-tRNA synthetase
MIPASEWPDGRLLRLVAGGVTVGITVEGDVDLNKAVDRLTKQIADTDKEALRLDGKLKNAEFVSKAPPEVIADHQDRLQSLARDRSLLANSERQLRAMLDS